ncbi:STN domain-containing protein [Paraburkholderia humisilvae]
MQFDLPAQPLALTLQAFGSMTEMVLLAPAPLLEGRTSTAVSGDYTPHDALIQLLEGTGLQADFAGPEEAMIVAQTAPAAPNTATAGLVQTQPVPTALPVDGLADDNEQRAYAAMIQERMTEALCAQDVTRPGNYRLVAQMRIDDHGAVTDTDLIATSGSPRRDAAIEQALRSLKLDSAPPPGLPEPVTILLRPSGNGVHINCPPLGKRG